MEPRLDEIEGRLQRSEARLRRLGVWIAILAAGLAIALLAVFVPWFRELFILLLFTGGILLGVLLFIGTIIWALEAANRALARRRRGA